MKIKVFSLIVLITTFLVTIYGFSQQEESKHRGDNNKHRIHEKLNLTDEQQVQIDVFRLAHQKEKIDLNADLEKRKIEMAELKYKGNYTREEYLNKVNEIISARNKIAISSANHQMDVYQLLDENQKKEWNKMSHQFGERREKKFKRMMRNFDAE